MKNTVSAITYAFVSCYEKYEESLKGKEKSNYVTRFSHLVSKSLYDEFKCSKVRKLLEKSRVYIESLAESMSRIDSFVAVYLLMFKTSSRLTICTRDPGLPLEISISWDPVLNLPYVPSSSLKGVVRGFLKNTHPPDFVEKLLGPETADMRKGSGLVVFTDAYPVECPAGAYPGSGERGLIEPDVVTPHYSEVKKSIDEASSSPTPLVFPTIARGVTLAFAVGFDKSIGGVQGFNVDVQSLISEFRMGLEQGIGAKTSVGYGRLKVLNAREISMRGAVKEVV